METRERLLEAAARLLESHGAHRLTVRAVCDDVGLSTIVIYRAFVDKAGLMNALYARGFEQLGVLVDAAAARHGQSRPAVLDAAAAYVAFAHEQPQHYGLMFNPRTLGFTPSPESVGLARRNFAKFAELVARLPDGPADADAAASDLLALVHGHIMLAGGSGLGLRTPAQLNAAIMTGVGRLLQQRGERRPGSLA